MTGEALLNRLGGEKGLADKLHVGLPFSVQRGLRCDLYEIQITSVQGAIRSFTITGLIDQIRFGAFGDIQ